MQYFLFLLGVFAGVCSSVISISHTDKDFNTSNNKLQNVVRVCAIINSTPKSFDTFEVTCNNGAVMKILNKE